MQKERMGGTEALTGGREISGACGPSIAGSETSGAASEGE